jgi:hypothetical protein
MLRIRISAALHTFVALYIFLLTLLGGSIAHAKFTSTWEAWVFLPVGIVSVIMETYTAVRQWRKPASGLTFSIVLHFLFAATVLTTIGVEYIKAPPAQLDAWLAANNYFFILILAFARIIVGISLVLTRSSTR